MVLNYAWVFWLVGGVLGALGLVVLARAVWGDRSKGRRRCPKCWYDMAGAPSLVCPECGKDAGDEKRLLRTRRRKRWMAVGVLVMMMGAGAAVTPRVANRGTLGAVPTVVLAGVMVVYDTEDARLFSEVMWRGRRGELDGVSRWLVCRRALAILRAPDGGQVAWGGGVVSPNWSGQGVTVRELAASQLTRMGAGAASAVPGLVATLEDEADDERRLQLIGVLGSIPAREAKSVPLLCRLATSDPDEKIRSRAARALGALRDLPGVSMPALRRVCREDIPEVRYHAVKSLGEYGAVAFEAVDDITRQFDSEYSPLWDAALGALTSIRIGAGPGVCKATRSEDGSRRSRAVAALIVLGPEAVPCIDRLIEMASTDADEDVRRWSLTAIGMMGPGAARAELALVEFLTKSPSPELRYAAMEALPGIGLSARRVSEHAATALGDPDRRVRILACYRLRAIGASAAWARERVEALLSDEDEGVAREAAATVKAMRGN